MSSLLSTGAVNNSNMFSLLLGGMPSGGNRPVSGPADLLPKPFRDANIPPFLGVVNPFPLANFSGDLLSGPVAGLGVGLDQLTNSFGLQFLNVNSLLPGNRNPGFDWSDVFGLPADPFVLAAQQGQSRFQSQLAMHNQLLQTLGLFERPQASGVAQPVEITAATSPEADPAPDVSPPASVSSASGSVSASPTDGTENANPERANPAARPASFLEALVTQIVDRVLDRLGVLAKPSADSQPPETPPPESPPT
ncbi:MAG: hypothetical protein SFZ03_09465 [Candidatus Melainabacteria bacterium]|nr:hypothetical protein [Candidatus Melainabacteria bacterium]